MSSLLRTRDSLSGMRDFVAGFRAVQVAGTNGKGSIATMVERIATAAGLRCGLYTSPHLLSWCERIRLPDGAIAEDALKELLQRLQPLALRHDLTPV